MGKPGLNPKPSTSSKPYIKADQSDNEGVIIVQSALCCIDEYCKHSIDDYLHSCKKRQQHAEYHGWFKC
eukprot:12393997-Ditylum_brightwellii.AAC.1